MWAERALDAVELTEGGRPKLQGGEVECVLVHGIDVELDGDDCLLRAGLVTLTTLRLIWVEEQSKKGYAVPLAAVSRMIPSKKTIKNLFSTPRLRLLLFTALDGHICSSSTKNLTTLTYIFRGNTNQESFVLKLGELLQTKPWEQILVAKTETVDSAVAGTSNSSNWNPSRAGVSGILRKEQEQWEQADKNLHDAFQDLNALMSKAREMVLLADKMSAKLLSSQGEGDGDLATKQEMQDWMLSVGIASLVTKESAGALYHQQLSRQLADFVWVPLQRAGGMLAMIDVYCLFNRARGTELISPEDLLQACVIWESIDVPVRMRKFESGVIVIETKNQSEEAVFEKIVGLVEGSKLGLHASDAAIALGVSPALAKEHLIAAENKGLLCRDDAVDGLRFFANFFKDIHSSIAFL